MLIDDEKPIVEQSGDFKIMQAERNKIFDRMTQSIIERHRNVSIKSHVGSHSPSNGTQDSGHG